MTAYLSYRMKRTPIEKLDKVLLYTDAEDHILWDIRDEILKIWPDAHVEEKPHATSKRYDLVIIAYFGTDYPLSAHILPALKLKPFNPDIFGFYEYGKRRLVFIDRQRLWLFILRRIFLRLLCFFGRGLNGVLSRVVP